MNRRTCSKCNIPAYGSGTPHVCASCAALSQTIEFDGLELSVFRDSTGAIRISIETAGLDIADEHPVHGVPKLRLQVNDGPIEQMNADGDWVQGDGYPTSTVLDHLAAIE